MKTIGVLGGIGPQATIDFEERLHRASQSMIPRHHNQGYPPLISVFLRHAPVILQENGTPKTPLELDSRVLDASKRLGSWADFLVITSNTPHFFLDDIRAAAGCEILSMIDVVLAEVQSRSVREVGLVGLGIPEIYRRRLEEEGMAMETAPPELRDRLDDAILRFMEGSETEDDRKAARDAVLAVRSKTKAPIILGCTEIPLLLNEDGSSPGLIHPTELLAVAAVKKALEE